MLHRIDKQLFPLFSPRCLPKVLPEALSSQKQAAIDVIIDTDEKPPLDRWVRGVGELNARLDYL